MTREIKFRVWSTLRNKKQLIYLNEFFSEDLESCDNWKVMQYTGLKDKNGKEIYDGDIVRVNDDRDGDRTYEVIFEKGCYWGNCIYTPRPSTTPQKTLLCDLDFFVYQSKEIIGNIYEHKYLLDNK